MKFSYFPGCTLKTKGAQLDTCGRKAAEALGFELCELLEWQCCGAVYPQATDEIATRLSSVRALAAADAAGQERLCKVPDTACAVEYGFQLGRRVCPLLPRQNRHAPC